ncbi:MAG: hypothetical protein Q9165_003324 [Trypethelium subeluteriae]
MTADDIVSALEGLRALVRDPVTKNYALRLDYTFLDEYVANYESKGYAKLNPEALVWTPYVMGRGNLATYEQGPALPTVAPREGEGDTGIKVPEEGVQMANGTGPDHFAATAADASKSAHTDSTGETTGVERESAAPLLPALVPPPRDDEDDDDDRLAARSSRPAITPQTSSFSLSGGPRTPGLVNGHTAKADEHLASQSTITTTAATATATALALAAATAATTTTAAAPHASATTPAGIPPTRFEVFPPIPGAASRRRVGRPFGRTSASRRNVGQGGKASANGNGNGSGSGPATPVRRVSDRLAEAAATSSMTAKGGGAATAASSGVEVNGGLLLVGNGSLASPARRTRSRLADMVNGNGNGDGAGDGDEEGDGGERDDDDDGDDGGGGGGGGEDDNGDGAEGADGSADVEGDRAGEDEGDETGIGEEAEGDEVGHEEQVDRRGQLEDQMDRMTGRDEDDGDIVMEDV